MNNGEILEILLPAGEVVDRAIATLPSGGTLSIGRVEDGVVLAPCKEASNGLEDHMIYYPCKEITFRFGDLNKDNGFDSGKLLAGFLDEWANVRGWPKASELRKRYLDPCFFLWVVWQEVLSSKVEFGLGAGMRVLWVHTERNVNPVRSNLLISKWRRGKSVNVPVRELITLADKTFGGVSQEWLELFMGSRASYWLREGEGYAALNGVTSRQVVCSVAAALENVISKVDGSALELLRSLTTIDLTGRAGSLALNFGLEELGALSFREAAYLVAGALAV